MRLVYNNKEVLFTAPDEVADLLDDRTAFRVQGFQFSPAWKAHRWDGKEHLVRKRKEFYRAPIGLLGELLAVASARDVAIEVEEDHRKMPGPPSVETIWNPAFSLRDYQQEAIDEVVKDRGRLTGKGLIRIPTRGGKTVVMAGIIHRLKLPTLVLVQSQLLLEQTVALFRKVLGIRVGVIGRGIWDPGPVTVASCQTLSRRAETDETAELIRSFDVVFFDEAHHLSGKQWRAILENIDAFYKVGFSATIFLAEGKEATRGTIWMSATTGPILSSRKPSDLIRDGWLIQPSVELVRVDGPVVEHPGNEWNEVYQLGIVDHVERNRLIIEHTLRLHRAGLQVLVVAERIEHTHHLARLLNREGLRVGAVTGETPATDRRTLVKSYSARKIDVLVGTVFGEAVDIPAIEAVVNAEGGKSQIAAMQRFRCLTPADGKDTAVLVDFLDFHHKLLAKHSIQRMKAYREHELFKVVAL